MADEDSDPMGGPQNAKTNPRYNWTTPQLPNIPDTPPQTPFVIDMNYLMPFSVMLMILCVLLLILCYLRHRMRQRRMLQRELRLSQLLHQSGAPVCHGRLDDLGLSTLQHRMMLMYPPTYDEALSHQNNLHKEIHEGGELPPPYTETEAPSTSLPHQATCSTQPIAPESAAQSHNQ